jgi:rare lipoprotein A
MTCTQQHGAISDRLTRLARIGWVLLVVLPACATRSKPSVSPPSAPVRPAVLEVRQGLASYYGPGFEGKVTASGARFDKNDMVAAHPSYPFGTVVRVTNLTNGRTVIVRVVDRGPAKGPQAEGVVIDVSSGAARSLGFLGAGRKRVRLEVLEWGGRN